MYRGYLEIHQERYYDWSRTTRTRNAKYLSLWIYGSCNWISLVVFITCPWIDHTCSGYGMFYFWKRLAWRMTHSIKQIRWNVVCNIYVKIKCRLCFFIVSTKKFIVKKYYALWNIRTSTFVTIDVWEKWLNRMFHDSVGNSKQKVIVHNCWELNIRYNAHNVIVGYGEIVSDKELQSNTQQRCWTFSIALVWFLWVFQQPWTWMDVPS